jgi:hypothetical protein
VLSRAGLFKVSDRIWQVRGFDIANVTFVKGEGLDRDRSADGGRDGPRRL